MADAQQICQQQGWGPEELLQLESVLCMAMAEPLCLSPNPSLGELAINRDRASKQMQSVPLKKNRRTWCESKRRKLADASGQQQSVYPHFRLHEFLKKKSLLGRGIPPILQVYCYLAILLCHGKFMISLLCDRPKKTLAVAYQKRLPQHRPFSLTCRTCYG